MKRWFPRAAIALAVLLAAAAALPYALGDSERRVLDDAARAEIAGATFVRLSDGVTHFDWTGPETGPVVVLVHGFSTPMWVWDGQVEPLAREGFRVLRYDLFGRGLSDRPDTAYTPDLFDRQLLELLDSQQIVGPVDVVGLSMGGAITVHFTARHPERVRRFALIAPAGLGVEPPGAARLLGLPLAGPWLLKAFGDRILLRAIDQMMPNSAPLAALARERYKEQMQYRGYKRALRSTLLNMPMRGLEPVFQRAGSHGKPCALFWGTADTVVPYVLNAAVRAAIPGIAFHSVEGAGHALNFEEPDKVNPGLIALLTAEETPSPEAH